MKNIINEEIAKIISEGYVFENENFKFKDNIRKSSFNGYSGFSNDFDVEIDREESDLYINWHVGFWLNDVGIENFIVYIDGVEGTYNLKYLDKQTDEVSQETDKDIAEIKWIYNVEGGAMRHNGNLYVSDVEFDFNSKHCIVTFTDNQNLEN